MRVYKMPHAIGYYGLTISIDRLGLCAGLDRPSIQLGILEKGYTLADSTRGRYTPEDRP